MNVIKFFPLLVLLLLFSPRAQAERWVIATLEWPPFICSRCPDNGAAANALRETLKKVDVNVEFVFSSWTQTVKKGNRPDMIGYFPAWKEEVLPEFIASPVLFRSPLGFIEPRGKPLVWNELTDLRGKKIGVTEDYGNTVEFNRLVKNKTIHVEAVISDDTNVRKVALGKLDAALMDINNARYLIYVLQPHLAGRVSINKKIVEDKELFFAFNKHNVEKRKKLEKALTLVNFQRMVDDYLLRYARRSD
ncbi:transporter substrate-binding domain-containing protein [Bdellovibrio sp. 22V]|uniref:substrate-binding periplasmic protein n=1 Tax=Bdellovibrio TaxID=958 RepID=UPI002543EFE5|nr:transporter substrate-binding domain-containing protein [Bdellovibrio sp. 22V]WII70726.1 transporter substrate-binding domain-containing protein [Bdellovibrio sp. 22V]